MGNPVYHLKPGDHRWPTELDVIEAPPKELWIRGDVDRLPEEPRVAIVGSRAPSPYGLDQARHFAFRLASQGVSIVSGLARGIDQAAHQAALEAGGTTLAVLGSGVDRPWPDGELARRIATEGVLVSEFPPGSSPRRHHFPRRNRLISGLADTVVVIEAAHASGSLITAHWAADQGKQVYALPGRVDHPMSRGCHRLLREGAQLIEDPGEVLVELGLEAPPESSPSESSSKQQPSDPLLRCLVGETLNANELSMRVGRVVEEVLGELVQHELDGRIIRGPGGLYRLARSIRGNK